MSTTREAPQAGVGGASLHDVLAVLGLVWAFELTLARVTSQPQAWFDLFASAVLLIGLPGLLVAALLRAGAGLAVLRMVAVLPLLVVAAGIVLPPAYRSAGGGLTLALVAALAAVGLAALRRDPEDGVAPSIGMAFTLLVGASASAWVLLPSGFPPFQIHVPLLLAGVLLARLASRSYGLPLVALGGVFLCMWPPVLPPFPWNAPMAEPDRADVVLVSVDVEPGGIERLDSFARLKAAGTGVVLADRGVTADVVRQVLGGDATGAVPSLAEVLARAGYDTAAVLAAEPEFLPESGLYRGFTVFHHFIDRNRFALPRVWALSGEPASGARAADHAGRPLAGDLAIAFGWREPPRFAPATEVFAVAAQVMVERRQQPMLLWLHFRDAAPGIEERLQAMLDTLLAPGSRPSVVAMIGRSDAGRIEAAVGGSAVGSVRLADLAGAAELRRVLEGSWEF